MGLKSISKALLTRWARRNARPEKKRRVHLQVEELEGRLAPAVFQPTTSADGLNAGTLRNAIIQANSNGQNNTIDLSAGTYNLSLAGRGRIDSQAGGLDLTAGGFTETIEGAGAGTTFINANSIDRVFQVIGPVTVIFQDLTITGGLATDAGSVGGTAALGGGILNNGGTLTLDRVSVTGNVAQGNSGQNARGGGIYTNGTSLTLNDSTISYNQALGGNGTAGADGGTGQAGADGQKGGNGAGGGIYLAGGALLVNSSTISHNQAKGGVGGIGGHGGAANFVTTGPGGSIIGGTTTGGTTIGGTTTGGTTIGGSSGGGSSGGGSSGGGSSGGGSSGGGSSGGGSSGGGSSGGGSSGGGGAGGNFAAMGAVPTGPGGNGGNGGLGGQGQGGGLFIANGMVSLINSTVADNLAAGGNGGNGGDPGTGSPTGSGGNGGGAGLSQGGGLFLALGTLDLTNDTVAYNTVLNSTGGRAGAAGSGNPAEGIGQIGQGGGSFNQSGTVNAFNTVFGDNTATFAPDFYGNFQSASYDLAADGTGSNLVAGVNGNLAGTSNNPINPLLGSLADNGGPTQTVGLVTGSPAVNAGSNALAVDSQGQPLTYDQRGPNFTRIIGGTVDMGAFELEPAALAAAALPATEVGVPYASQALTASGGRGGGFTFQVTAGTLPPGLNMNPDTGALSGMARSPIGSPFSFTVTATDGFGDAANQTYTIAVASPLGTSPHAIYVENLYGLLLHRAADPGASYWVNQLNGGMTPSKFVSAIEGSSEFLDNVVTGVYEHYLNRAADPSGLKYWVGVLQRGATVEQVIQGFIASPEFYQVQGGGTNAGFVTVFYRDILNRSPDPTGYSYWLNALNSRATSPAAMAWGFLRSEEYEGDLVSADYLQYLRRTIDGGGFNYWTQQMQAGLSDQAVLAALLGSAEGYADWS